MNTKPLALSVSVVVSAFSGASAQTWEQVSPPLDMNYPRIACSADGTTLLLSGLRLTIPIYLSTNSGATWKTTSAPFGSWGPFAISVDKRKFVAANYWPRGIYSSADGGTAWTSNNVPSAGWTAVAGSADGQRLAAVNNDPKTIHVSTNGGADWTEATNAPLAVWRSVASSADGTRLIAVNSSPGTIYRSKDGGAGWEQCTNAPTNPWIKVVSSAGGSQLLALPSAGQLFTSADSGDSWAASTVPSATWTDCAASADFSTLIVASKSGFVYTSSDSGATWKSNTVPARVWNSVALSADGSRLFAAADGANGGVWRSLSTPAPRLQAAVSPSSFHLAWTLPSLNFLPQQSADCKPSRWEDLTNLPPLNLSNLQYEVTLPLSNSGLFRLRSR